MAYFAIEHFKGGLDKRRMELTSEVGSLQTLKNAHITRGGEIEKAFAWPDEYTLPAGTFGYAIVREEHYVFGSAATPGGLDPDINYQRLQSPDDTAMTEVMAIDVFAGKLYVIARFTDGVFHFYDGTIIGDWYTGVVRSSMTNNDGIAEHLRALIDASPLYSASRVGSVVTITGSTSNAFTITATARNGEGNAQNNQTATVATTQEATSGAVEVLSQGSFRVSGGSPGNGNRITSVTVDGVEILGGPDEVLAEGDFNVTGGTSNPGVNVITEVLVNGVDILGAPVDHTGDNSTTAAAIRAQINSFTSSPDYTASGSGTEVVITAAAGSGATPNGFVVNPNETGDVTFGSISNMSGGEPAGVEWVTSNSATAQDIVDQINAFTSGTEYTASRSSSTVIITALAGTGATPNGRIVAVVDTGTVAISDITDMQGGVTAGSGLSQISTVTIGGTFEPGDLFSVFLASAEFGAGRVAGLQAEAALKIHKNKVYAAEDATLLFSGVAEPTKWKAEDTGSGAIDMSSQASGFEDITAISVYQNNLAVFARNSTQIWFTDPDPDANQQLQVLENIGTRSPGSVVGFGDSDVFFLGDTGIRSLRARDSSNAAAVSDVGTPIDPLIVAVLKTLTADQITKARAIIEPTDGRYILSLGQIMYVFSYFASSKVSSWSTYERGFQVDWFAKSGTRVYARVGDTIKLLGGDSGAEYSDTATVVELPYVDGNKLANFKGWTAVDMAMEGVWLVEYNNDPNQPTVFETIGTYDKNTINELNSAVQAFGPVFKLRFTNTVDEQGAKIGTILIHYKESGQT